MKILDLMKLFVADNKMNKKNSFTLSKTFIYRSENIPWVRGLIILFLHDLLGVLTKYTDHSCYGHIRHDSLRKV